MRANAPVTCEGRFFADSVVERSQLPNGIRIVSETMLGARSVTIGIWVENGSRFENTAQGGISHFLEHVLFKGTERRTAAQIAEEIDAVGGVLNAFTGKEYTCYYARVLPDHLAVATDLLADIFLHSRFDEGEIERERNVVIQEISQLEDTPDEHIHDFFCLHYWPGHPLSRPICGNTKTVSSFRREDLVLFFAERYRPDRIIIAAAGAITHEQVRAWALRDFSTLNGMSVVPESGPPQANRGLFVNEKPLEQVHICVGTPGVSQTSEERFVAYLINTALGGGMSSRLFQEIRERRGHAYTVHSFLSAYRDVGYIGIYAGTSPEWVDEVCEITIRELRALAFDGLRPEELIRAKNQLKGNLLLGLETSDACMSRIGKNEIYAGRDVPVREVVENIDAITNDQIVSLAQRLFGSDEFAVAVLGDLKGHRIGGFVFS